MNVKCVTAVLFFCASLQSTPTIQDWDIIVSAIRSSPLNDVMLFFDCAGFAPDMMCNGYTLFEIAFCHQRFDVAQFFMCRMTDIQRLKQMARAIECGSVPIFNFLIARHPFNNNPLIQVCDGRSLLEVARQSGQVTIIDLLRHLLLVGGHHAGE